MRLPKSGSSSIGKRTSLSCNVGKMSRQNGFDADVFQMALMALLNDLKASEQSADLRDRQYTVGQSWPGRDQTGSLRRGSSTPHFCGHQRYQTNILRRRFRHPSDAGMKLIADTLLAATTQESRFVELSEAHIAAVNRQRRIYVNNDVGYDSVAMGPKLTDIKPDEWLRRDSARWTSQAVRWNASAGALMKGISPLIPADSSGVAVSTLLRWRNEGVDIAQAWGIEERGESSVSWPVNLKLPTASVGDHRSRSRGLNARGFSELPYQAFFSRWRSCGRGQRTFLISVSKIPAHRSQGEQTISQ